MAMQLGGQGVSGERLSEAGVASSADPPVRRPARLKSGGAGRLPVPVPWIAGFVFFLLIPLGWAVWLSFTDEQLLRPGEFIGFDNYVRAFTDDRALLQGARR